jgi:DNA repair protein RecO (recombination protein O)
MGPVPADSDGHGITMNGQSLLSLAREELADAESLKDAKRLMRAVLGYYLGDKPLKSRELIATHS